MIVTKEFIWKKDHYVCHITEEKNMQSIIEKGLIPMNGDRCRFVMDNRKGVFCLDGIQNVETWACALYEQYDLETLKLLRFNLKGRKWYLDNSNDQALGIYLPAKVLPEKISYLDIKDQDGEILPLNRLFDLNIYDIDESFNNEMNAKEILIDELSLSWQPIYEYEKDKQKVKRL